MVIIQEQQERLPKLSEAVNQSIQEGFNRRRCIPLQRLDQIIENRLPFPIVLDTAVFQRGNDIQPETLGLIIARIQREPGDLRKFRSGRGGGRISIPMMDPHADQGAFAKPGRRRDDRQRAAETRFKPGQQRTTFCQVRTGLRNKKLNG